jgi:hypothetical protein
MVTNGESQDKLKWAFQLYDKGTSTPQSRFPPIQASRRVHRVLATTSRGRPVFFIALPYRRVCTHTYHDGTCFCVGHACRLGRDQMATACWTEMRWWT